MSAPRPANPCSLVSPDFIADPYPSYHRLRTERPVCWDESFRSWLVSRYADVHALLRDGRFSSRQLDAMMGGLSAPEQADAAPLREILTNRILLTDEPDHRRIRSLMQLAFTPRRVELMRPIILASVNELLDRALPAGRMELVAAFADPLPSHVIATMLGLPPEDHHQFKSWTDDIYGFLGISSVPLAERARKATDGARHLRKYLAELFAQIRQLPRDDLLSALVAAEEQGERLTETELFSNVVGLINASHETTTNLIANTTYTLLRTGDWQRLVDDPSLAADAVEEGLRYESPIQMLARGATEEVRLGDVTIAAGDRVALLLGSANRDPAEFPDPDRFDLSREKVKHVAFGGGPHFCLGAALGRLEGQIALEALSRRVPKLRLATEKVAWRPFPAFRGLTELLVTV